MRRSRKGPGVEVPSTVWPALRADENKDEGEGENVGALRCVTIRVWPTALCFVRSLDNLSTTCVICQFNHWSECQSTCEIRNMDRAYGVIKKPCTILLSYSHSLVNMHQIKASLTKPLQTHDKSANGVSYFHFACAWPGWKWMIG